MTYLECECSSGRAAAEEEEEEEEEEEGIQRRSSAWSQQPPASVTSCFRCICFNSSRRCSRSATLSADSSL